VRILERLFSNIPNKSLDRDGRLVTISKSPDVYPTALALGRAGKFLSENPSFAMPFCERFSSPKNIVALPVLGVKSL
jgi:hypothetical protein